MPRKNRPVNPFGKMDDGTRDRLKKAKASRVKAHRKDMKPRSDIDAKQIRTTRPELTRDVAEQFVKVLAAGVPATDALVYFAPEHFAAQTPEQIATWQRQWLTSNIVIRAFNSFNGGAWEELDKDRRLELSVDKTLAELAYFLYTHNYQDCYGIELTKHDAARKDLMAYVKAKSSGDDDAPWIKAMREIIEGKIHENKPSRDILTTIPTPMSTTKES